MKLNITPAVLGNLINMTEDKETRAAIEEVLNQAAKSSEPQEVEVTLVVTP